MLAEFLVKLHVLLLRPLALLILHAFFQFFQLTVAGLTGKNKVKIQFLLCHFGHGELKELEEPFEKINKRISISSPLSTRPRWASSSCLAPDRMTTKMLGVVVVGGSRPSGATDAPCMTKALLLEALHFPLTCMKAEMALQDWRSSCCRSAGCRNHQEPQNLLAQQEHPTAEQAHQVQSFHPLTPAIL